MVEYSYFRWKHAKAWLLSQYPWHKFESCQVALIKVCIQTGHTQEARPVFDWPVFDWPVFDWPLFENL